MDIRPMRRDELDRVIDWAANEGWNPGLHDAEIFWNTDPEGFVAAEQKGQFIGGGSIVSYGSYGFMGLFIVDAPHRGKGLGTELWWERKRRMASRIGAAGTIGMDGVFDMQPFYEKGGFAFSCRHPRYGGTGQAGTRHPGLVELSSLPFDLVNAYDQRHFPDSRPQFLSPWIQQPDARALGMMCGDSLTGMGVVRRCRSGFKIGPLFADTSEIAEHLFVGLSDHAQGQPLFLDPPENNPQAIQLARRHAMTEVFGCARLYAGPHPTLPHHEIFGITTFELG